MDKDVLLLTGAGQIGMAIARRMGMDKKFSLGIKISIMLRRLPQP